MHHSIELSFVIPLFNEEEVFDALVARLQSTMQAARFPCEVVLVDDGSRDSTPQKIQAVCEQDTRFQGVLLSRNFGQQSALSAGLDHARGNTIGILDGDLQDPPEALLDFHKKLGEGYDVVYAIRKNRTENRLMRLCYWVFYRLLSRVATIPIPLDAGDFCLMSRRVVREISAMPERHRFLRGMRCWVGMRQIGVSYQRAARAGGKPKYTLSKLVLLAADGLLTFSEAPLRIATCCGTFIAAAAFVWGTYILIWRLTADDSQLIGFATLGCGMFFLGGIQLICLGIVGEYIARIHNEVKGRPLYVVARKFGIGLKAGPPRSQERPRGQVIADGVGQPIA